LTKRFPIPIYCTALTRQVVRENFKSTHERLWKIVTLWEARQHCPNRALRKIACQNLRSQEVASVACQSR
jgi:hypothetical protein